MFQNQSIYNHGGFRDIGYKEEKMFRKNIRLISAIFFCIITMLFDNVCVAKQQTDIYKSLALFSDVFDCVKNEYVTSPNTNKLIENAINGMLTSLDPHSSYLNADEAKEMNNLTKGEFAGIGIVVTTQDKLIKVVSPMLGTPAAKAGVLAGDLITKIDGKDTSANKLDVNVKHMRGKRGTLVTLTIERKGVAKPFDIKVRRDIIKIEDLRFNTNNNVGYIRLLEFTGHTYDDLAKAIASIKAKIPNDKLKGYILDLRLNPGGLLNQAVKVSDAFLDKGMIVSTKGRQPRSILRFDAKKGDLTDGKPLIVLINGGTASAAEIVAGALQDNKRAKIVGSRSFGKGSVQTIIPLGENGALRLTTALYYTPSGVSIQGHGIIPDYKISQPLPDKYKGLNLNIGESELKGHIKGSIEDKKGSGSSAYVPLDAKEDQQLKAAYNLFDKKT